MRVARALAVAVMLGALAVAPATAAAGAATAAPVDFAAVAFATPADGWVVGPGFIWRTYDAGHAWKGQYRGAADLTGVDAVSPATAYAWGGATVLRTTDGGRAWRLLRLPRLFGGQEAVLSVSAAGRATAYVAVGSTVVGAGAAYVTRDGGRTWTSLRIPFPFAQLAFTSPADGWAVTRPTDAVHAVYRTADGGRTWTRSFTLPAAPAPGAVGAQLFVDGPTDAYLLLSGGSGMSQTSYALYHTADGTHWHPVVAVATAGAGPAPGNPQGVSTGPMVPGGLGSSPGPVAVTRGVVYAAGECRACDNPTTDVVRSDDAGHTWTAPVRIEGSDGLPTLSDLSFATPTVGYLAVPGYARQTSAIFATHDGGRTWTAVWRSR